MWIEIVKALGYLAFTPVRKVWGLVWFYVVVRFREDSRSIHYNYVLQNPTKAKLPRLTVRPIKARPYGWQIEPFHGTEVGGYIRYEPVNWLMFQLNYWLVYGWLDDDANHDTYDRGHLQRLIKENKLPKWVLKRLQKTVDESLLYGNSFDLGDRRAEFPSEVFSLATFMWNWRNTGYNFSYCQFEKNYQPFYFDYKYFQFGYKKVWNIEGTPDNNYCLVFGFKRKPERMA